ncbi:MAG: hypothetical protein H0U19_02175, partial [Acidobacteria bacterium]|nr:hypothetical protein [Acidobacteriota bacterium]
MNTIAERYVRLVLAVGQHDADYVDAYYGPAEWKPTEKTGLDDLVSRAAMLSAEIDRVAAASDDMERLRHK